MPPVKRAPAKAKPADLDRELDDDTPDEPEAIEERDDADDPIVVLSRTQVVDLLARALDAAVDTPDADGLIADLAAGVEFQEVGTAEAIPGVVEHHGLPEARMAIGYYPAAQRHNDIRRPAQALAAAASRAEDHVTAGVEGAADLIVVAVEPGQGDTVKAWLELALGLVEPAVQD